VLFVEGYLTHWVHLGCVVLFLPVTFEAKVARLSIVLFWEIVVLNTTPAFHWANYETFAITKYFYRGRLVFQRALVNFYWVKILLVEDVVKVPNMNELFRVSCDHKRKFYTHVVNWFADVCFTNLVKLVRGLPSPKFDFTVPTSAHDNIVTILWHVVNIFNRLRVCSNLHYCSLRVLLLLYEIPLLYSVIWMCDKQSCLFMHETQT
jgi:hypothetical protein